MFQNILRSEIRLVSKRSYYGGVITQKNKDKDYNFTDLDIVFCLLLSGSSGALPTPRTPFWLVVSPNPRLFSGSSGVLPTPRILFWLVVSLTHRLLSGSSGVLPTPRTPSDWSFPQPPPSFRFFWGFTQPKDPLRVGRFPNPPPSFLFFWGFACPKDPFWLVAFIVSASFW